MGDSPTGRREKNTLQRRKRPILNKKPWKMELIHEDE
jgi:hypothetical protein